MDCSQRGLASQNYVSITVVRTCSHLPGLSNQSHHTPSSSFHSGPIDPSLSTTASSSHQMGTSAGGSFQHPTVECRFRVLPPQEVLHDLIDVYFARVQNQPYSFFHERSFREKLALNSLPEFLIFAVLASALRFSSNPYYGESQSEAIKLYASESWKLIVSVWFGPESDPDIHICQAMTLLSIIDFTAGRPHPGWLKIGLSIRIAQDLRLMMEPSQDLEFWEQEERRRVFWSIYILDKLCSCGRARPAALADVHCFVQLPCDEISFRKGESKKTPTLEQAFSATESPSEDTSDLALVVLTSSVLGRCAQHSIHQNLRGESSLPPWDSKSLFATIYSFLLHLETNFELGNGARELIQQSCRVDDQIDMQLAGPIIFSRALFRTSLCVLHHPLLLHQQSRKSGTKVPPSFWGRAMQTCRENACSISELLQEVQSVGCQPTFSFMGYCVTLAASIHTLYSHDGDVMAQKKASEYLEADKAFLELLSHQWKNGEWMLRILEKLVKQSTLSPQLITATPDWGALDKDQLETIWATIDYNTMSEAPKEHKAPLPAAVRPTWDAFKNLGDSSVNVPTVTQPDQSGINLYGDVDYFDAMAFTRMSPFASFFDGGGTSFGG
ncbi:Fungal specific transcription factor domain containing protein [Hyaloscypha variabilis]